MVAIHLTKMMKNNAKQSDENDEKKEKRKKRKLRKKGDREHEKMELL